MTRALQAYMAERGVDWATLQTFTDDIRGIAPTYIGPALPPDTDIWGIVRQAQSYGTGHYDEIAHYPLAGIQSPEALDAYPWPNPDAYDYEHFREQVLAEDPEPLKARKLAIDTCGNPFEIYCWMTGLEASLVNVLLNPDLVHAALTRITDFFAAKLERALDRIADLVDLCYFADDLGGQRTLLMSRATYRAVLQPYHARLFKRAKALAPQVAVMYHSDGAVFDVLPDLMEAGIDVLEAVQVDAEGMAPEHLKRAYGDRLAFHGGLSVQTLLPHADAETVVAECQRVIATFRANGGYIAAPTHAIQVGTPPENVLAMLRAVLGDAGYEAALAEARIKH
jgi:uroporphyrinogen decarboxylase